MEPNYSNPDFLDLMLQPGFCVKDGCVIRRNAAARAIPIEEGTAIADLLHTGREEYAAFTGGCLYLSLMLGGIIADACVTRMDDFDVFWVQADGQPELKALSLAAAQLRLPLSGLKSVADSLAALATDADTERQLSLLNQRISQLHRLVNNMSDAAGADTPSRYSMETMNVCAVLEGIFDRAASLAEAAGLSLSFRSLPGPVFTLGYPQQLERAVWNILSNALKFTPRGGSIAAELTLRGRQLRLTVTDSGSGIAGQILGNLFRRYTRQPGLEDSRFGMGLGMVLIWGAATCHGGTVLIDSPEGTGTRITLTMMCRDGSGTLRSPILRMDYAGEMDHALIELSDSLPWELYRPE